jgi:hypothetical protein
MAAILVPNPHHPLDRPCRPDLRLVPGGAVGRPHRTAACYRRRRLAAALLAAVVLVGLIAGGRALLAPLAAPAPAGPAAATSAGTGTVVVRPGDTLWTIARRAQPVGDIRPLVDRLVAAHGSGPLTPGERISIPG